MLYMKNIKKSYEKNEFKKSAPTWSEEFELPDGSYSITDIQDYVEIYINNMNKRLLILQYENK